MIIYNKNDPNNWYNSIPVRNAQEKYNPYTDPNFDADNLKENEIEIRGQVLAKIPTIKDRIRRVFDEKDKGYFFELIIDRYRDEKTGETREKRERIGYDLSDFLPGMMLVNENYHVYFDKDGFLFNDPLGRKEAAEAEKKAKEETRKKAEKKSGEKKAAYTRTVEGAERTVDEIRESLLKKEKELNEKLQMAKEGLRGLEAKKEELDELIEVRHLELAEREKAHIDLLRDMLGDYEMIVDTQAKKKPDMLMRQKQIQTINGILAEIRECFSGSEAEDYLQLAEEPREDDLENHPGTTYGEMAVILVAYSSAFHAFLMERLYEKRHETDSDETEDT